MDARASTRWPSCVRRNCRPIRSPGACLRFEAGEERRFAFWSVTGKDSGWRRSGCRRGVSCGGRAAISPRESSALIRRSCCWPPGTRMRWRRWCGGRSREIRTEDIVFLRRIEPSMLKGMLQKNMLRRVAQKSGHAPLCCCQQEQGRLDSHLEFSGFPDSTVRAKHASGS